MVEIDPSEGSLSHRFIGLSYPIYIPNISVEKEQKYYFSFRLVLVWFAVVSVTKRIRMNLTLRSMNFRHKDNG